MYISACSHCRPKFIVFLPHIPSRSIPLLTSGLTSHPGWPGTGCEPSAHSDHSGDKKHLRPGIASMHPCVPGSQDVCLTLVYFFHFEKCKAPGNSFGYPAFPIHGKTLALKAGYTTLGCSRAQLLPCVLRA